MEDKKQAIKKYLSRHTYDGSKCVNALTDSETNEVFELYINNVEVLTNNKASRLFGYYATYYAINKKYDQMVEHYVLAVEENYKDFAAANPLYDYLKSNLDKCDPSHISRVCEVFKKHNVVNEFARFNELLVLSMKIYIDNKIRNAIDAHLKNNEVDKIYALYGECKDNETKTQYLSKVMSIKDFKPTKEMINDLLSLDCTNASLEVKLFKSIFAGYKI